MSAFVPQLVRAIASGAALETGRAAVRRNGMGFLSWDDGDDATDWGNDWAWWLDDYGNYYQSDWFFEPVSGPTDYYQGLDYGFWTVGNTTYTFDPDDVAPSYLANPGDGKTIPPFDWSSIFDWLPPFPGYEDAGDYSQRPYDGPGLTIGPNLRTDLPGYCPKGTYHPQSDPYACVPFPANDPNAKKQASAQQKAQQSAANALKAAQKKQDQACPKHPQGLPVWKNPQTGNCEVVPQCTAPAKFDSTARRCLTPAQVKELYGDNNWLWWLLAAGVGLMLVSRNNSSSGGRRR